jgi:hypothetical protein
LPAYDLIADRDKIVTRFETAWTAVKVAAMPNATRPDVRAMLAEYSNRYRTCARQIADMRDPKAAAKRKAEARRMRRDASVERFVIDEVAAFWQRDTARRGA